MPDPITKALIARAQAGNAAAIGAIYDNFHAGVYRFLFYRVGNHNVAEDLTAEVFLKMIQALPGYRNQAAPFQAWIYRIARNLAVDHYRKMKVRDHVELHDNLAAGEEDLDAAAERGLVSDQLVAALKTLTDDQRDVIVLRFVAEMPITHVARTLDKSETAIKALQRRGLQSLRKILGNWKVEYV